MVPWTSGLSLILSFGGSVLRRGFGVTPQFGDSVPTVSFYLGTGRRQHCVLRTTLWPNTGVFQAFNYSGGGGTTTERTGMRPLFARAPRRTVRTDADS